jgi:hypothetical protein
MSETKFVSFSPNREHYGVGDTVTIGLDNGEVAVYTLTEIK